MLHTKRAGMTITREEMFSPDIIKILTPSRHGIKHSPPAQYTLGLICKTRTQGEWAALVVSEKSGTILEAMYFIRPLKEVTSALVTKLDEWCKIKPDHISAFDPSQIIYELTVEPETHRPTEHDYDPETLSRMVRLYNRVRRGDASPWQYGTVCVTATMPHPTNEGELISAREYLGMCNYKDREDFIKGGYYEGMKKEAAHWLHILWNFENEKGAK